MIFCALAIFLGYTILNPGTKEAICEEYALKRAQEKIERNLSELVKKKETTSEDLEKIEEYKEILEKKAYYRKDYDYYYNQCMY